VRKGCAVTRVTMLIDRLYRWLEQSPPPEPDTILACALERAEAGWDRRIIDTLRRRGHAVSYAALLARYDDLPVEIRAELHADVQRLHAAIEQAFRMPLQTVRVHALRILECEPSTGLLYQVSACLRDANETTRALAARVLRTTAAQYLEAHPPGQGEPEDDERRRLVKALEESLRTFGVHRQLEALEACLWFARDLEELLWRVLESRRLRLRDVVIKHLHEWEHPHLAPFLLQCLRYRRWRKAAERMLALWRSPDQLSAILNESDLLDQPDFRTYVRAIREPRWFEQTSRDLHDIPDRLRAHVPRWVRHAGFSEDCKRELLCSWVHHPEPAVQRSAVYALADANLPQVGGLFRHLANGASPLARFARWYLHGRRSGLVRKRTSGREASAAPPDAGEPVAPDATEFNRLWRECRGMPPHTRTEQIEALRAHADAWRIQIRASLNSPDPRDRVLALQVISTRELATRYRNELEQLLRDEVPSIRRLACTLLRTVSSTAVGSPAKPPDPAAITAGSADAQRERLCQLLTDLAERGGEPPTEQVARQIHELLRAVYGNGSGASTHLAEDAP